MGSNISTWTTERENELIDFLPAYRAKEITCAEIGKHFNLTGPSISQKIATMLLATKESRDAKKDLYLERFNQNIEDQENGINIQIVHGLKAVNRICVVCGRKFLLNASSSTMTDSNFCEELWEKANGKDLEKGWHSKNARTYNARKMPSQKLEMTGEDFTLGVGEPKSKSRIESEKIRSSLKKKMQTQNGGPKNLKDAECDTRKTKSKLQKSERNTEGTFPPKNEKKCTKKIGLEKTKTQNLEERNGRNIMNSTEQKSMSNQDNQSTEMIPAEGSQNLFTNLKLVESVSMNLIDDTAKQLYGYMGKLIPKKTLEDDEMLEPESVLAAAKVGETILGLMKLKLEAIKVEKIIEAQRG